MTLHVDVQHQLADFQIDAKFESAGGLTVLFGSSGAGKTSIINMIAGLSRPASGQIKLDNVILFDCRQKIDVPAHKRRIGYVFQDARLFPHLSVKQNLNYGSWFSSPESGFDRDRIIALLGIEELMGRMPNKLSGGEKQRVAIGRALFSNPKMLLMDEPLASLDQSRKSEIMSYIETLRDTLKIPIVYVSHSEDETSRLASQIVTIENGHVIGVNQRLMTTII